MGIQQVVEELHIELIVLHDQTVWFGIHAQVSGRFLASSPKPNRGSGCFPAVLGLSLNAPLTMAGPPVSFCRFLGVLADICGNRPHRPLVPARVGNIPSKMGVGAAMERARFRSLDVFRAWQSA